MGLLGPWDVNGATNKPPCEFYFILSSLRSLGGSWSRTGQRARPREARACWFFPIDLAVALQTVPATAERRGTGAGLRLLLG